MAAIVYSNILHKVYSIFSNGNQYKVSDLLPLIQEACGFTDEQMKEMTDGGSEQKVKKLVQWAVTHLYAAGLIDKVSRGTYVISAVDKNLLSISDKEFEKEVKRLIEERKTIQRIKEMFPKLSEKDNSWALSILTMEKPDLGTIRKGIRSLLVDANGEISIEDLQELLKEATAENDIQYELVVKMTNKGNKREPRIHVDFVVKDSKGNEYPFKLETRQVAEYLTFLYMGRGVLLQDFCTSKEKPNQIFQKIYESLYNRKGPIKSLVWDSDEDDYEKLEEAKKTLNFDLSNIRGKIAEAVPNDSVARQFVIAGNDDGLYTIQGSNDDIRDKIRKTFSLN